MVVDMFGDTRVINFMAKIAVFLVTLCIYIIFGNPVCVCTSFLVTLCVYIISSTLTDSDVF